MQNGFLIELKRAKKEYEEKIVQLQEMLFVAPEGKLHVKRKFLRDKGGKILKETRRFYQKIVGKKEKYIAKGDTDTVSGLAQKMYAEGKMDVLTKELELIGRLIELESNKKFDVYGNLPDFLQPMVKPLEISDEEYGQEWLKIKKKYTSPYEKTEVHHTENGDDVRSKNEQFKANSLCYNHVLYVYEAAAKRGKKVFYPDLTILNKHTRKEYIFEDFGMMDDEKYYNNMQAKISEYMEAGYFPGQNFFFVFETKNHTVCSNLFYNMVKYVFDQQDEIDKFL